MFEVGDLVRLKDSGGQFVIIGYSMLYQNILVEMPFDVYVEKIAKYNTIYTVVEFRQELGDNLNIYSEYTGNDFSLYKKGRFSKEEITKFVIKAHLLQPESFWNYVEKEELIESLKQRYIRVKDAEIQSIIQISSPIEENYTYGFFVLLKNHQIKLYFKNRKTWYFLKELYSRSEYLKEEKYIENNIMDDYSISKYDIQCRYNMKKVKQPDIQYLRVLYAFEDVF